MSQSTSSSAPNSTLSTHPTFFASLFKLIDFDLISNFYFFLGLDFEFLIMDALDGAKGLKGISGIMRNEYHASKRNITETVIFLFFRRNFVSSTPKKVLENSQ